MAAEKAEIGDIAARELERQPRCTSGRPPWSTSPYPVGRSTSRTRGVCREAYAHQEVPFGRLVEALRPEPSLSHNPLFQVTFALAETPDPRLELPVVRVEPLPSAAPRTSRFDLTLK
jgi:hypothetical protein